MPNDSLDRLKQRRDKLLSGLPVLAETMRGTFITCSIECGRRACKCHRAKKHRHGPYHRVSVGVKGRMRHIYVPVALKRAVKQWTKNYDKLWKIMDAVSLINSRIIRAESRMLTAMNRARAESRIRTTATREKKSKGRAV